MTKETGKELSEEGVCENVIEYLITEVELAESKVAQHQKELKEINGHKIIHLHNVRDNLFWWQGRRTTLQVILNRFKDTDEDNKNES